MKKIAFILITFLIVTIIFLTVSLLINNQNGKGALQVIANSSAQVFLNGKFAGKTPLCLCELQKLLDTGDYYIKLVPDDRNLQNFEQKITISKGILTVVDRVFNQQPGVSSGSVITFSIIDDNSRAQLLIISSPQESKVILDNSEVGLTPLLLNDVTASDHEVKIIKDGYGEKTIKIKTLLGKKLEANVILGINTDKNASSSSASAKNVVILDTPTGYLRVRKSNSVESEQIATVNPGDRLEFLEEKDDWYRVKLRDGKVGWVSTTYSTKE